jgi:hypothetical protein
MYIISYLVCCSEVLFKEAVEILRKNFESFLDGVVTILPNGGRIPLWGQVFQSVQ